MTGTPASTSKVAEAFEVWPAPSVATSRMVCVPGALMGVPSTYVEPSSVTVVDARLASATDVVADTPAGKRPPSPTPKTANCGGGPATTNAACALAVWPTASVALATNVCGPSPTRAPGTKGLPSRRAVD